jgi:hypothetical protein
MMTLDALDLRSAHSALLRGLRLSSSAGELVGEPNRVHVLPSPLGESLPDGGFPQGGVVELTSPANLGQGVSVALAACAAAQTDARLQGGESSLCAWLDPNATLYAPAVEASGVVLDRLLVVRPPLAQLASCAVRIAASRAFALIVVDLGGVPGTGAAASLASWANVVRRLALAIEGAPTTVLLLTSADEPRAVTLPVCLRLELEARRGASLSIRVTKDRRGRLSGPRQIAWTRPWYEALKKTAAATPVSGRGARP